MNPTVRRSETIAALAKALAGAQAEMRNPAKDSVNPHFRSRYADLATVRDAVIPALARQSLAVVQLPCESESGPTLVTLLIHSSGEWIETSLSLRATKNDPQGIGSALTYARRYALQSVAGVAADDDDDGEAGARPQPQQTQPARKPEPVTTPNPTPEPVVPGDPVTDCTALVDLAKSKGFDFASVVLSINQMFNSNYSLTQTRWLDIKREHREATIEALKNPKKVRGDSGLEDFNKLLGDVAALLKLTPMEVFYKLVAAAGWLPEPVMIEDLTTKQLRDGCKSLRAKLAEKGGKS